MTVSYFALYQVPDDPASFEEHYFGTHVPLVEKVPGLVENRVHRVVRQFVGKPGFHLVAELVFQDADAMAAALRSDEWTAAGEDLRSWGGLDLAVMFSAEPHGPRNDVS
jgi:uncharacterized protein (TIGR02118 family)